MYRDYIIFFLYCIKIIFFIDVIRSLTKIQKPVYIKVMYVDTAFDIVIKKNEKTYNPAMEPLVNFLNQFKISGILLNIDDLFVSNE